MKNENRHYHKLKCEIFHKINSINQQDFKVSDKSLRGFNDFILRKHQNAKLKTIRCLWYTGASYEN